MPGVKPFVEVGADRRVHDAESDSSGYAAQFQGRERPIGTTFDLTRLLTGEIAVGYTQRTYEDARLAPLEGLIGNASLIWTADALNTVKLSATSTAGESTDRRRLRRAVRDIGLQFDHAFRRWLIGSLSSASAGYLQGRSTSKHDHDAVRLRASQRRARLPPDRGQALFGRLGITYKINRGSGSRANSGRMGALEHRG